MYIMEIKKTITGSKMVLVLSGRLDTNTSPQLEAAIKEDISSIELLEIDLVDLAYISSAGLRVLLSAQKIMNKQGDMIIRNVNEDIMDVFEVTGFVDILNIEL